MYPVNFARQAENDIEDAAIWYDSKLPGLSKRLFDDLNQAVRGIQKTPQLSGVYKKSSFVRKKSLNIFPYKIFYIFSNKEIFVIAVIHHKRSAKYIGRRLK